MTGSNPHVGKPTAVEKMLMKDVKDRPELYNTITKRHQTNAVAVIFILRLEKKSNMHISSKSLMNGLTPVEEIDTVRRAREVLFNENLLFNSKFKLVKYDDKRVFAMATDPTTAMEGMIYARKLIQSEFDDSSSDVTVSISGGCELGGLFELTNDYYGDPVNVASKLGEDTADAGQLLVSFGGDEEEHIAKLEGKATFELGKVEVSGVTIEYYIMNENDNYDYSPKVYDSFSLISCCAFTSRRKSQPKAQAKSLPPKPETMDDDERTDDIPAIPSSTSRAEWKDLIMLQSDLSGFTRLTKKYGILHFMTLIMQCRKIFDRHLAECSGELLKYEGDNVICKFESSDVAVNFVLKVSQDIANYNEGKDKDYQIRVKLGMAKGLVLVTDHGDIAGDAWEECCALGEEMGKVGEILISEAIKSDLKNAPSNCRFESRPGNDEVPAHYNMSLL